LNATKYDGTTDGDSEDNLIVLKEYMLPVYVDMKARKQALERFESEARMLSRLQHDSIVKLLDFFVEDHRAYLVLEYIRGDSLRARIEKNGPVSEEEAISLGLGMCDILQYLQEQSPSVVHRDFTPDNLLQPKGRKQGGNERVKLIDFMVAQEGENTSVTSAVVGKQSYMPPEQFRGKAGVSSDVYACGATLYFLLTGEDPEALSPALVHLKRQDVSIELAETIRKATALEISERFADARELRAALSTCTLSARSKVDPLTSDAPQDAS
jgi:serine/threonine protein kinase